MRAPVRSRDLEGARGQPRLIGERVFGRERILLEPLVHRRRIGQHALEQRRRDGENLDALPPRDRDGALQSLHPKDR